MARLKNPVWHISLMPRIS